MAVIAAHFGKSSVVIMVSTAWIIASSGRGSVIQCHTVVFLHFIMRSVRLSVGDELCRQSWPTHVHLVQTVYLSQYHKL